MGRPACSRRGACRCTRGRLSRFRRLAFTQAGL